MTKICFTPHTFSKPSQIRINQANEIIDAYELEGYTLTLRQLHYQFVSTYPDEYPNTMRSYKNLVNLMTKARYAGLVSWTAIADGNRELKNTYRQERLEGAVEGIEGFYVPELWAGQDRYVEVWIEKDALSNVIERPCRRWGVRYIACKGYLSSSEMYQASLRFRKALRAGKTPTLVHLGDHDPSGIDMTRDNGNRLGVMDAIGVDVQRIALNMDQIEEHNPPPNPAKITDPRATDYIEEFGDVSWELDALKPSVIDSLLSSHLSGLLDDPADFYARCDNRDEERKILTWIGDNSYDVIEYARGRMSDE